MLLLRQPQEEQRRISNRESCRDEWFTLMRDVAAQTHSFAARQLGRLSGGASGRVSESGRSAATAAGVGGGDEAALLGMLQHSAADLLRRLRPDNYAAFAELFTAAVLQVCLAIELAGTRMPAAAVAGKRRPVPLCCCRGCLSQLHIPALVVPPSLACASYLHATSRPTACCNSQTASSPP